MFSLCLILKFTFIYLFFSEVAHKNMAAHRPRNRKTTVLYAMSLAFIVFISTAYNSQIDAFVTQIEVIWTKK